MKISVVIPAYNEADRILPSLERIIAHMAAHHPEYEILVVDDGSSDGTAAAIQSRFGTHPALQVLVYGRNRGKGYAVRYGAQHASGDLVLFSDADLSTPIEELEHMLPRIEQGYDFVIGTRADERSEIRRHQPFYRELAGKLFNLLVRLLVTRTFHDTQCGFKLFRRDRMLPILQRQEIDGFAFDVEMIALAEAGALRVTDVPVVWINSPGSRVRMAAAAHAYLDLLRIRKRAPLLRQTETAPRGGQV